MNGRGRAPGRDLGVKVCRRAFSSAMNLLVLSAALINGNFRLTPQSKGILPAKQPYHQLYRITKNLKVGAKH